MKGIVVAAPHSGSGKTTVSLALMAALRRRGYVVQAFKVGPDFIDPGHHSAVTGRLSHNLDGWMLSREDNLRIFRRYAAGADFVVVEGVMGLYDGAEGQSETGSTAQMAKWLDLPVLLCVQARSMARSLAALAFGFVRFDPDLSWAGLVANQVGSPSHTQYLSEAMASFPDLPFWGGLVRDAEIGLPERHLGLVTAQETAFSPEADGRLADWLENGLDMDGLLAALPEKMVPISTDFSSPGEDQRIRLGVARDEAFCFYYQENLRRLEAAGAVLVPFSPLRDMCLPAGLDGLYIGGGYPELYAAALAANHDLRRDISVFGRSGRPVYAECGGLMYLSRCLEDLEGRTWPMVGLLPFEIRMLKRLKSLGYRQVTFSGPTPLGPSDLTARGHEFHYSEISKADAVHTVYSVTDRHGRLVDAAGSMMGNVLGSYVHLHFGSQPKLAPNMVTACRYWKEQVDH